MSLFLVGQRAIDRAHVGADQLGYLRRPPREHLYPLAQFLFSTASMLDRMDELEEPLSRHEILQRFKKLLGREMTPGEWQVFFLSDESTLSPSKNISSGGAVVVTS
jgi:hypothetical protein